MIFIKPKLEEEEEKQKVTKKISDFPLVVRHLALKIKMKTIFFTK